MRPNYKKVLIPMPHCTICGEMLKGNNSYVNPWRCSCGEWEYNNDVTYIDYKIKSVKRE